LGERLSFKGVMGIERGVKEGACKFDYWHAKCLSYNDDGILEVKRK